MLFGSKKDKFSLILADIAANLKDCSKYFAEYKIKNINNLKELSEKMKEFETKGDSYIHQIIMELNKTFITPLEREDILQLAMRMDDVLDGLEHCSARFEMYSIPHADGYMIKFVEWIYQCTLEIAHAIELLAEKKLSHIRVHAIKIKDYESKCDDVLRESIKDLFVKETNPIKIIQYKELYELFEEIADNCQDVANTLETIVMKNA
jgi:uncharacterized protein